MAVIKIDEFIGTHVGVEEVVSVYVNTLTNELTAKKPDGSNARPSYEEIDPEERDESLLYEYCNGTSKVTVFATNDGTPYAYTEIEEGAASCVPVPGCTLAITSLAKTDETATGANNGTLTITANEGSIEYSINGIDWQTSNAFSGIAPGSYTASVRSVTCTAAAAFTISAFVTPPPEEEDLPVKFDPVFNPIFILASSYNSAQPGFKFIFDIYANGTLVARRKQSPVYNDFQSARFDASPILKDFVTMLDFRKGDRMNVINQNTDSYVQFEVKIGEAYGGTDYPDLKTTGIRYAYSASLREHELYTFITDDFKIFGNGCEIIPNADGGTAEDPISFVVGYFNGNSAPAGVSTCPTTNTIDGGLVDEPLDTVNFLINGNPPYFGSDGYNTTPNSAKKFLTFADRWQDIGLNETYQLSILAEPGFEYWSLQVETYNAAGELIATTVIDNTESASIHLQVQAGPRDLNRIHPNLIGSGVAYYKVRIIGSEDALLSEQMGFRVKCVEDRFDPFRLHFLNRLGGYDAFTFTKLSRKFSEVERQSYQKRTGSVDTLGNNYLSTPGRFDPSRMQYGGQVTERYTLNSDWITDAQAVWLEDLYSAPLVYLESNNEAWGATASNPVFIPVSLKTNSFETQQRKNGKLFNVSIEIEFATHKRQG